MTSWTSNSWAMWAVNPTRYRQMYLPKELGGGSSGSVSGSTQLQNSTATPCAGPEKSSCKKIMVMDPRKKLVSCNSHSLMIMLHGGYGPRVGDILKMQGLTWFTCLVLVPSFCECPSTHGPYPSNTKPLHTYTTSSINLNVHVLSHFGVEKSLCIWVGGWDVKS